jgi:hypothetical protein
MVSSLYNSKTNPIESFLINKTILFHTGIYFYILILILNKFFFQQLKKKHEAESTVQHREILLK